MTRPGGRAELVWPGKYDGEGRRREAQGAALPLEVAEIVGGQTIADGGPPNLLVWGENLRVLASLARDLEGKVDLVYMDPPFATGADFALTAHVGDARSPGDRDRSATAYRDGWDIDEGGYLEAMDRRLRLVRALLAPSGTVFVHCDWHVGHRIRCLMDEVFGEDAFKNEIVWRYRRWPAKTRVFQRMHDTIFWYGREPGDRHAWTPLYEPLAASTVRTFGTKRQVADFSSGRRKPSQTDEETLGAPMSDVWDIGIIAPIAHERLGYPTQKPEALLRRIVEAASRPGDLVLDPFCGSGTTLAVAEKLGRRWVGCDRGRHAIHTARKRLVDTDGCRPFEVATLGRAERAAFAEDAISLVLKRYGAASEPGRLCQGRKGDALVAVVPARDEGDEAHVRAALDEAIGRGRRALHVLAWSWAPGPYAWARRLGEERAAVVRLLVVPRELMDARGDPRAPVDLFDLPDAALALGPDGVVALEGFALEDTAGVARRAQVRLAKWSDAIDAWAVDVERDEGAFVAAWSAHRTRRSRALPLRTAPLAVGRSARVRIVDVFGNETMHRVTRPAQS